MYPSLDIRCSFLLDAGNVHQRGERISILRDRVRSNRTGSDRIDQVGNPCSIPDLLRFETGESPRT